MELPIFFKPRVVTIAAVTAASLSISGLASGAVLVNDTFDVGASPSIGDDADDPQDVAWTAVRGGASLDTADTAFTGNALQLEATGITTFNQVKAALPAPVSLTHIDDFIRITAQVRAYTALEDNGSGFRLGFVDSGSTTSSLFGKIAVGASSNLEAAFAPNPQTGGSNNVNLNSTASDGFDDQDVHTVSVTLVRTASGADVTVTFDGDSVTGSASASQLAGSYDEIWLATGSVTTDFRYDNIVVETGVIPEPASLALFGLGGLWMLGRWGRR